MEYQKIRNYNILTILHGTGENRYKGTKQLRFKTSLLRFDLRDYSDAYIVVERDITVEGANETDTIEILF